MFRNISPLIIIIILSIISVIIFTYKNNNGNLITRIQNKDFIINANRKLKIKFLYISASFSNKSHHNYFVSDSLINYQQYQEVMSKSFLKNKNVDLILRNKPISEQNLLSQPILGLQEKAIKEFISRLSTKTGMELRIPTKREYEIVCSVGLGKTIFDPIKRKLVITPNLWGFLGLKNQTEITTPNSRFLLTPQKKTIELNYVLVKNGANKSSLSKFYCQNTLPEKLFEGAGFRLACSANELGKPKLISEAQRGENVR